jgi:predicted deacylase
MSTPNTLVWTTIDYDKAGKQVGVLNLEHSVTRSGYGMIRIPIGVIKNGTGPTILLMAGNHGDEYEGQIALSRWHCHINQSGSHRGRLGAKIRPPRSRFAKPRTRWIEVPCTWAV